MPAPPGRLRSRRDFDRVFAHKWRAGGRVLAIAAAPRGDGGPARVGWVISSKVVAGAVERNRLRRRLRAIITDIDGGLPSGLDLAVIARSGAPELSYGQLHAELSGLVERVRRAFGDAP